MRSLIADADFGLWTDADWKFEDPLISDADGIDEVVHHTVGCVAQW